MKRELSTWARWISAIAILVLAIVVAGIIHRSYDVLRVLFELATGT